MKLLTERISQMIIISAMLHTGLCSYIFHPKKKRPSEGKGSRFDRILKLFPLYFNINPRDIPIKNVR